MGPAELRESCALDEACKRLMKTAMRQMNPSPREFEYAMKLARGVAVLAEAERIETAYLVQATQYSPRSR